MMEKYEFTYIVDGVDPHADDFEDRFYEAGCDDATLTLVRGIVAVNFMREAPNYVEAVVSALDNILQANAIPIAFEPDYLIDQAEIAERIGKTKQAIGNYVSGERRDNFPLPRHRIGRKSPLWDWVDVSKWAYEHKLVSETVVRQARVVREISTIISTHIKCSDKPFEPTEPLLAEYNKPLSLSIA